jgi:hypothetical protein
LLAQHARHHRRRKDDWSRFSEGSGNGEGTRRRGKRDVAGAAYNSRHSHYNTRPVTSDEYNKPQVWQQVILIGLPPRFLEGLPEEDQRAITAMVGKAVMLVGYDDDGDAELEFADPFDADPENYFSHTHTIWVAAEFIAPVQT